MSQARQDLDFLLSLLQPDQALSEYRKMGGETLGICLSRVLHQLGHDATPISCIIKVPMHGGGSRDLIASALRVDGKAVSVEGVEGEANIAASAVEAMRQGLQYSDASLHRRNKPKPGTWEDLPVEMSDALLALSQFHARVNGGPRVEDLVSSALAHVGHRDLSKASGPGASRPRSGPRF